VLIRPQDRKQNQQSPGFVCRTGRGKNDAAAISVADPLILLRKRSADAYIRELDRRERRERKCHVVITGCDVLADVGIRAPLRKNAKASFH